MSPCSNLGKVLKYKFWYNPSSNLHCNQRLVLLLNLLHGEYFQIVRFLIKHYTHIAHIVWLGGQGKHQLKINIYHSSELTVSIIYSSIKISNANIYTSWHAFTNSALISSHCSKMVRNMVVFETRVKQILSLIVF